jgi:uncharacterized phage-associated protein
VVSVHDVAAYILKKTGEMTAMKLQKLVYYCQAWSLVWDERPLFPEDIEAWANGPVVYALYNEHRGVFKVSAWPCGSADKLDDEQQATVEGVLNAYGDKPSQWLSDLTHMEAPWREARNGTPPGVPSRVTITHSSMAEYYGGLS